MWRRHACGSACGLVCVGGGAAATAARRVQPPALRQPRRGAGVELLAPLAKLGNSRDLADDLKAGRQRQNKEIRATFDQMRTMDEIYYRKTARPWELVPKYAKKRVSDLVGILTSEDRMEMEQAIDKMQALCRTELYVVIVPTVGYTMPRVFASSIFFDWAIGEPRGNGLLLLIAQHEATVQLIASPAIEEYFDTAFLSAAVGEIFAPLVREGCASYAALQLVYAIARQAQEMHTRWEATGVLRLPMPVRNKVRFARKTVVYGVSRLWYVVAACAAFTMLTVWLVSQLLDTLCPRCHRAMHRVRDAATMQRLMTRGQYLEQVNGCAHYRVWHCPHCADGARVVLCSRDLHQSTQCLKCVDCNYYTCNMSKDIVQLPTKTQDGLKKVTYTCANCHVGREVLLPLLRPVDKHAEAPWYDFLLQGGASAQRPHVNLKV